MALTEPRDQFRLELGDTDPDAPLLTDEECDYFLGQRADNVLLAAADACEALARRFARAYDFETDNQSFKRSQQSKQYAALAVSLKARAQGVTSVSSTRVDGYSQDISNTDVFESSNTGRRRFYGEPDAPF